MSQALPAKARGERNGNSRLTEQQVREVLAAPKSWGMCTQFATRFNVTTAAISDIFRGRTWGHIK